jgi:membrane protein DedA with SNARE-associated domain
VHSFLVATILDTIQRFVENGGYYVIFGLLFACGLGLPLPEDVPLIIGGYFVANGHLSLLGVAIAGWLGIMGGDCMLYWMGHRFGMPIAQTRLLRHHVTRERIERVERLFERYGVWVVAGCRLVAGIRGAMVLTAGIIRYNFVTFIIADGLAALVSGGLWVWLGHWAGRKLGDLNALRAKAQHYEHYVIGGLVAVAVAIFVYKTWQHRRHKPPIADAALQKVLEKTCPPDCPPGADFNGTAPTTGAAPDR